MTTESRYPPLFTSFRDALAWHREEERRLSRSIARMEAQGQYRQADAVAAKLQGIQHRLSSLEYEAPLWGPETHPKEGR